ncbi:MAG: DNA-3-methyladenine glycosylase I [Rickettsiales endosymbiont of Dermacentor nuttalli]
MKTRSIESDYISKDLKKRGMSFIGTTIIYAYMQAVGLMNSCMNDMLFFWLIKRTKTIRELC